MRQLNYYEEKMKATFVNVRSPSHIEMGRGYFLFLVTIIDLCFEFFEGICQRY